MLNGTTAIFGTGPFANRLAETMVNAGGNVVIISSTKAAGFSGTSSKGVHQLPASVEVIECDECRSCRHHGEGYSLKLSCGESRHSREVERIVVAEPLERVSVLDRLGLRPSPEVIDFSDWVKNSEEMKDRLPDGSFVAFLSGIHHEARPMNHRLILESALSVQRGHRIKTMVFTGNLKVAATGLDALYQDCRRAGVVVVKSTKPLPAFHQDDNGVVISWHDDITRETLRLRPALVVADEIIRPSKRLSDLARALEIEFDETGFAQADNVHRLIARTNRRGIYAAGPSRDYSPPEDDAAETACVALSALVDAEHNLSEMQLPAPAEIRPQKCVRCLTCYRLCPYRAISVNSRLTVDSQLCRRCGICAAECPATAIDFPGLAKETILQWTSDSTVNQNTVTDSRKIRVFGCTRSAGSARLLAESLGEKSPVGVFFTEVPCAGAVSIDFLLSSFLSGADGVLVLACHEGNCHSRKGSSFARNRVAHLAGMLEIAGIEAGRLSACTLASNMGIEFSRMLSEFAERISAREPLKLNGR